jgi:hypothetical protein
MGVSIRWAMAVVVAFGSACDPGDELTETTAGLVRAEEAKRTGDGKKNSEIVDVGDVVTQRLDFRSYAPVESAAKGPTAAQAARLAELDRLHGTIRRRYCEEVLGLTGAEPLEPYRPTPDSLCFPYWQALVIYPELKARGDYYR